MDLRFQGLYLFNWQLKIPPTFHWIYWWFIIDKDPYNGVLLIPTKLGSLSSPTNPLNDQLYPLNGGYIFLIHIIYTQLYITLNHQGPFFWQLKNVKKKKLLNCDMPQASKWGSNLRHPGDHPLSWTKKTGQSNSQQKHSNKKFDQITLR